MFIRRYLGTGRWELELVSYIMLWFYSLWVFFPEAPDAVGEEFQFWCLRTLTTCRRLTCSKKDHLPLMNGQETPGIFKSHCLSSVRYPPTYGNHEHAKLFLSAPHLTSRMGNKQ